MRWSRQDLLTPSTYLRRFIQIQMEELPRAHEFLDGPGVEDFSHYYRRYLEAPLTGTALERQVRGGVRSTYGHTLERLLRGHPDRPVRVLDAGCGFGSECLLFALSGAHVVGIDLRPERHAVAVKRVPFWSRETGVDLKIDIRLANVFDLSESNCFDLIWVHNAISHIHPVDKFLEFCRELLAPGGEIVIIDVNKASIRKRFMHKHDHEHAGEGEAGLYKTVKDPNTGADVVYAVERDLTLTEQCELLRQSGLEVASTECFVGFHGRVPELIYRLLLRPLNRTVALSSVFGNRYVVVGRKA